MVPIPARTLRIIRLSFILGLLAIPALGLAAPAREPAAPPAAGESMVGVPIRAVGSAVVNLADLSRMEARLSPLSRPPIRPLVHPEINEEFEEPEFTGPVPPSSSAKPAPRLLLASPAPTSSFIGLDDIPMVDSSFIIIPPDVNGAVGQTKIFQNLNNNVRILNKSNGSVVSTVGVNTFWAPTGASANNYTDPRTVYDPYNNRWITIMQGDLDNSTGNSLVIGLSDTDDPSGTWHLYRTILHESNTYALADFPTLGFNRNWITVSINMFRSAGTLVGNSVIAIHYPSLRANVFNAFRFDRTDFCAAPCQTYSATSDTEYVLVHLSSTGATYRCDRITGTGPGAPTYTASGTLTRTGGGWVQPGGQTLPQSAPNSGTSSCGATPCPIELIDAQIRTPPVFRNGSIWYAQTIGLPSSGLTHTAAQWTRITTPSGLFVDGGRIEDPTATASNGGQWYAYPQIAVNAQENFIVGYSQFSSAQHPAAGYSVHFASDGAGTIRDPFIAKPGEDYYHKDFGSGRNRWGDFTTAQVDPVDDLTLWTVDEYAKNRVNTNDGTTGSNGSRWSTWWSSVVAGSFTITASAGSGGSITPSGAVSVPAGSDQSFTITPAANHFIANVLVDGSSVGAVPSFTFTSVGANHTIAASFLPDSFTVTVSVAGQGSVTKNPDLSKYADGSTVQLTATPVAGFGFSGWSGDTTTAADPITLTVHKNITEAATFADTTHPAVQVIAPAPRAVLTVGTTASLQWSATDNVGIASVDLWLSRAGAVGPFDSLAISIANTGSFDWTVTGPATTDAFLKVVAHDPTGLTGTAISDSAFTITDGSTDVSAAVVREFALEKVSPQPVRGTARLRFAMPRGATIRLTVHDVQGREVAVLADGAWGAGVHEVPWGGSGIPSGLYFVKLRVPGATFVQRLVRLQ